MPSCDFTFSNESITTSEEHPIWVSGKGWVEAKNIRKGDSLEISNGSTLPVEQILITKEYAKLYNFRVQDFHTYYVSNLQCIKI
ncbi:hypothetical protein GK047_21555 [Paenibacillus sp. SYP-B3998]|uniref:Hint domain-containing protein n=1 Tax=Paenibacillus sp. SYP-B3998 TaxID=2678564 RepID=A0A6G4A2N6_9BACL|nr:hypothetical protein [Paenibacillus sp. SYP-B3998]